LFRSVTFVYPLFRVACQMVTRPCNTSPASPLKFRTSGFPQYGFKLRFNHDLHLHTKSLSASPAFPLNPKAYTWLRSCLTESQYAIPYEDFRPIGTLLSYKPTTQSRDPWLSQRLCCPPGSSLTMVSSETLNISRRLIFFVLRVFALRTCMG